MDGNFLVQLASKPTWGSDLLDLLFTNREGLVEDESESLFGPQKQMGLGRLGLLEE